MPAALASLPQVLSRMSEHEGGAFAQAELEQLHRGQSGNLARARSNPLAR